MILFAIILIGLFIFVMWSLSRGLDAGDEIWKQTRKPTHKCPYCGGPRTKPRYSCCPDHPHNAK